MPESNITKNALAASMKKLMSNKPFAKISVSDICEDCGMNRKSFYYHFKDKYDLVNWIFYKDFICGLDPASYDSEWELFDDLCVYFYGEREFYKNALEIEGQNSFREYFREAVEPILRHFMSDELEEEEGRTFYLAFFCEGFLAAIMNWLAEGFQIPPEVFLDTVHQIIETLAERVLRAERGGSSKTE